VCEQAESAVKIVSGIGGDDAFEIRDSSGEVAEFNFCDAPAIERIDGIGAGRDRFVVAGAGAGELAIVKVKKAELFIVARGRIVENSALQFVNAAAAGKGLKRSTQQAGVGNNFGNDVNEGTNPSQKQNDEQPVGVRTAADEMDDRDRLKNNSPPRREEEKE